MTTAAKNLSQEAPRSPRVRLGDYVVLARAIDKGHADLQGTVGEFHYDCPLDKMLFEFKGVTGDELKKVLATGATDEEIVAWLNSHGTPKSASEIKAWSDEMEARLPYQNPERREWWVGICTPLGLKPETTRLFDYLEADDLATFKK
jgi:hypothetical protein